MPKATKKAQRTINRDDIEIEKEVANLSDRELAEELKNFGMSPGPITGSTRSVYERKLVRLRVDGPQESKQTNGSDDYSDSDEGSSSDEDNSQDTEVVTRQTQVRKREVTKKSLHVTQVTEEQTKRTSSSEEGTMVSDTAQTTKTQTTTSTTTPELKKRLIPVFVQIIILLLVALFIFLILYNMESLPQRKIPESLPGGSKMKVE
ncbi:lamina-associated polypeptide 2-like isoform X2 [Ptychodera flava]|uniref:lamina-associated polypeptide 2-like isoform X2 n=1 Tax=Ptychodera flava TaxID=63121 RepID=UPI00396A83C2